MNSHFKSFAAFLLTLPFMFQAGLTQSPNALTKADVVSGTDLPLLDLSNLTPSLKTKADALPQTSTSNSIGAESFIDRAGPDPALPVDASGVILTGSVISRQADLGPMGPETRLTVSIQQLFKNSSSATLSQGASLIISRYGARIKMADGGIHAYRIHGQRMPQMGATYMFFLYPEQSGVFGIEKAYLLQGGDSYALDSLASRPKDAVYDNVPTDKLMADISRVLAR